MIKYCFVLLFILIQVCFSVANAKNLPKHSSDSHLQQYLLYSIGGDPVIRLIMTKDSDYTLIVTNTSNKVLSNFSVLLPFGYIDRKHSTCPTSALQAHASCTLIFDIPPEGEVHYADYSIKFIWGTYYVKYVRILPVFVKPLSWVADNNGLPLSIVVNSATDDKGTIYIGAIYNGIYRANSDENQWTSFDKGLPSNISLDLPIYKLIAVNGLVYLSTKAGVFVTNGDKNGWIDDNMGFGSDIVSDFAVNNHRIYAGTLNDQIYSKVVDTSAENGKWKYFSSLPVKTKIKSRILSLYFLHHAIYAGTAGNGLYRSTDNGKTWVLVNLNSKEKTPYVYSIVSLKNSLFIGTGDEGIFKSTDGGNTWVHVNNGIASYNNVISVSTLAVFGGALYAASNSGIYRSNNSGANWKNISIKKHFTGFNPMLTLSKGIFYTSPVAVNGQAVFGIYRQEMVN